MKKSFVGILTLVFLQILASGGYSTQVPKMSIDELAEKSAYAFIGHVEEVSYIASDSRPTTIVVFSVTKGLMGDLENNSQLAFYLPEGPLSDGSFLKIVGAPEYRIGEDYLLFIREGDWYLTPVTNWFHSSFRILHLRSGSYLLTEEGTCVHDVSQESGIVSGPLKVFSDVHFYQGPEVKDIQKAGLSEMKGDKQIPRHVTEEILPKVCLPLDKFVSRLEDILPVKNYTPNVRFQSSSESYVEVPLSPYDPEFQ